MMDWNGRTEWFQTSLIVRKILAHFPNQEILSFSLVNPIWNLEVKSLLKVRGRTGARMGTIKPEELVRSIDSISDELREAARRSESENNPEDARPQFIDSSLQNMELNACEDIMHFARLIESMAVIPYCNFNLQIRNYHHGSCVTFDESVFRSIIEAVPITSLSFSVFKSPEGRSSCHALRFLELLFTANAHQLGEIFIGAPTELNLNPDALLNRCKFPQLRVLTFDVCDLPRRPTVPEMLFLSSVVERAPNLEYVELQQSLENHPRDLNENKISFTLVQNLFHVVLYERGSAILVLRQDPVEAWKVSQNFLNRLAVRYFDVLPPSADHADVNARTALLINSRWTLLDADLDILSLATAFRYQIPFPNMRELSLEYNWGYLFNEFWYLNNAIQRSHRWAQCFPNLEKLVIYATENEHDADIMSELQDELSDGLNHFVDYQEDEYSWLANVRELNLLRAVLTMEEFEFLCNLCPNVTRFSANMSHLNLHEFWSHLISFPWAQVIELDTTGVESDQLESRFCGIFPAELMELREKDAEFLKKVHIVPVGKPIAHLEYLTKLELHFRQTDDAEQGQISRSGLSKVSAGLCFSRMPNLSISCHISKPESSAYEEHGFECILKDFPEIDLTLQIVAQDDPHSVDG